VTTASKQKTKPSLQIFTQKSKCRLLRGRHFDFPESEMSTPFNTMELTTFYFPSDAQLFLGSAKRKAHINPGTIELVREIEKNGRHATSEE
jgi:hypothetical protein